MFSFHIDDILLLLKLKQTDQLEEMVNRLLKPFTPNMEPTKMEGQAPTHTDQSQQECNYMSQQTIPRTLQLKITPSKHKFIPNRMLVAVER